jgi:shikimate dehydrogenase
MSASAEGRIGGATRVAGVIGWPVEHSLSPAIHNAAFAAADLDWAYVPLPVRPAWLEAALIGVVPLGIAGANVTMPHKTEAADLIDDLSEDAELLRAVNTIRVVDDRLQGHNTDVGGFDRFLRRDAGFEPAGRSALIYGAGGGARVWGVVLGLVALALARAGLGTLTVAVRAPARAAPLVRIVERFDVPVTTVEVSQVEGLEVDLLVNATPVGVPAEPEHRSLPVLDDDLLVVDLLYDPPSTALQRRARAAGATVFGGVGLLVEQAALSFELWTGTPAPLEVMSAAALAALAVR